MSISLFGSASNPADNSHLTNASLPLTITPPASMVTGDLVFVHIMQRSNATTLSVSEAGGQSWNSLTQNNIGSSAAARKFWCIFNGTWSADPSFTSTYTGGTDTIGGVMLVFRSSGSNSWSVDTAQAVGNTTPSSPYAVTVTGQDPTDATSVVTIASVYNTSVLNPTTYALQTGGWTDAGTWRSRNGASTDIAVTLLYKITTDGSATGDVTTNGLGAVQHNWTIITFAENLSSSIQWPQYYWRHQILARY